MQAVICDQGSPNVKAVRNLGASLDPLGGEESHCILVGVQRVPVIFDVPHLLKSIRNNLKHALQVSTVNKAITIARTHTEHTRYHNDSHMYVFTSLDTRKNGSLEAHQPILWAGQAPHYSDGPESLLISTFCCQHFPRCVSVWLHRCSATLSLLVNFFIFWKTFLQLLTADCNVTLTTYSMVVSVVIQAFLRW